MCIILLEVMTSKDITNKDIRIIEKYLTNILNYDVSLIILKHLNIKNHNLNFKYCINQINYLQNEFSYIIAVKSVKSGTNYWWCPNFINQFITLKNREKISTH